MGEAGYKYWRDEDATLMAEYNRRTEGYPFTRGTDSNMLVYDYFYGLDMPLLCMEVMNGGFSGIAAWMLDDAMHSSGDSGKTEDIKLWGMWNILGEEVFNDASQEEVRPWYYTWALMCRYFPAGSDILRVDRGNQPDVFLAAATYNGRQVIALVNVGEEDQNIRLNLPNSIPEAKVYRYEEGNMPVNTNGYPIPVETGKTIAISYQTQLKAQSFMLITNMD